VCGESGVFQYREYAEEEEGLEGRSRSWVFDVNRDTNGTMSLVEVVNADFSGWSWGTVMTAVSGGTFGCER
jgi:hypothetical protein